MVDNNDILLLSFILVFIIALIYRCCALLESKEQRNYKHTSYILREKELEEVISSSPKSIDSDDRSSSNDEHIPDTTNNEKLPMTQKQREENEGQLTPKKDENGEHQNKHHDKSDTGSHNDKDNPTNGREDNAPPHVAHVHDEQHHLLDTSTTSGDEGQESQD